MSVEFEELLKARDNPSEEAQSECVVFYEASGNAMLERRYLFDLVCTLQSSTSLLLKDFWELLLSFKFFLLRNVLMCLHREAVGCPISLYPLSIS